MYRIKPKHRIIAVFLTLNFLTTLVPVNLIYASNNGPNAPEAAGFEPVDATDMVNLATGDLSYVLPLLDMNGFPVTMSYHAGVPLDMESSWIGLGWNLNTGAINRSVSGTPDDWKNGNSLDFIYYQNSEEFYSINVGLGLSQAAEVGVGMSWGSNKSLTGSVYASAVGITASIDTDGNYSLGVGISKDGSNYGGSLSVSGNVNSSKVNVGVGAGARTQSGAFASMGYNFGSNSFSIGAGKSNKQAWNKGQSGSGSLSISNYSAGDFDISSKGFYIPIQLGPFSLGFGRRKVTYKLDKAYQRQGYGILYAKDATATADANTYPDTRFDDIQHRYTYGDSYEEAIPIVEDEFVADYKDNREKVNFSFASYDAYDVNAPGISGIVQPKVFQNATLIGMGYYGSDSDDSNKKMRVYYHNGNGGNTTKTFGTSTANTSNDIKFYFNGKFTENVGILSRQLGYDSHINSFDDMLGFVQPNNGYENSINQRQRSGNYVEVFTNQQLATGNTTTIMYPETFQQNTYANFDPNGIGAYKITSPDGKTYHYSLPVYHYERMERTVIKDDTEGNVNEKRQYSPFATHWLLTAVTGPDYMDTNSNNLPDNNDHGYWVRLDHGQWSDGFVWRSPYKGKDYNTNLVGDIEDKDYGNYQTGRKQLYYLDKIVTREQTAYFVKDVRYDATGAYGGNNGKTSTMTSSYNYNFNTNGGVENAVGGGTLDVSEYINYPRSYQLRLDHIVLVNNGADNYSKISISNASLDEHGCLPGYSKSKEDNPYGPSNDLSSFAPDYGSLTYNVFNEDNVYDMEDFASFDYTKAVKVIQLGQDYSLAKGTPSSISCTVGNPFAGRLTLNYLQFRGKDNATYMPPYKFAYKNEMDYPNIVRNKQDGELTIDYAKDPWGFIDEKYMAELNSSTDYEKYGPDNWSLTQVRTPVGGTINMEYEEDDYYIEAFSRRFWQDNLQFAIEKHNPNIKCGVYGNTGSTNDYGPCYFTIYVQNLDGIRDDVKINFKDYFEIDEKAYLDLWVCKSKDRKPDFKGPGHSYFNLPKEYPSAYVGPDGSTYEPEEVLTPVIVEDITSNTLILKVGLYNIDHFFWGHDVNIDPPSPPVVDYGATLNYYGKTDGVGSGQYRVKPRGERYNSSGGDSDHTMFYKLLANKVDRDLTGGGLRVKSITVEDGANNQYKTAYYYNKPGTNSNPNDDGYESSGITSYAPERGLKYVPYQPELPSPGVMYEHVTMEPLAVNGAPIGKTVYEFYTLQPIFDIFDPNIEMFDTDGTSIFQSEVLDYGSGGMWVSNTDMKAYAKKVDLKINTSLIGQFKSISNYNSYGQLMSKTTNTHLSGEAAKAIEGRGSVRESFQTMKSVYTTNSEDNNPSLKKRLISISSKEEYSSVLKSVESVSDGFTMVEEYFDADPQTGAFRTTETTLADGVKLRTTKLPAYAVYPSMGSKVDDPNNKNMLTQEAMATSSVELNGAFKSISASVTTWKNSTLYETHLNETHDNIWRKHATYVYNGALDDDGTFGQQIDETYFDWSNLQNNTTWKKLSETMRYNYWSVPLEVMDINGNYISTIMGDNNKKIIASGNARHSEIIYSGAEYINETTFENAVLGAWTQSSDFAHTGMYSSKLHDSSSFVVVGEVGEDYNDVSKKFRPGKYKISVWGINATGTQLYFNAQYIDPSETISAGDWTQYNFYVDLLPSSNASVEIRNLVTSTAYYDDFRMHPISSSMTSYVYNEWDELAFILGPNNLATQYKYDEAGRLDNTYNEVIDFNGDGSGGFKMTQSFKYNYQNIGN